MTKWLLIALLSLSTACEQIPLDEPPLILSMNITGIPPQNISINQLRRLITVVLPATLPSLELVPSFTLSNQAYLSPYWTNGPKTISVAKYCPATSNWVGRSSSLETVIQIDNQKQTSSYTIQLKSAASLQIKPLTTPLVYDSKSTNYKVQIPVENYYGSAFIDGIALTKTGSDVLGWVGGGNLMETCQGLLNKVEISLYGFRTGGVNGMPVGFLLEPGLYDLNLRLADGTEVHAVNYLLIK